jgi:DNA-binding MarR family transcriptional regulator
MAEESQAFNSQSFATPLPLLTDKQARCLSYIYNFFVVNRDYPTHREIAEAMRLHSTNALPYLEPLVRKGYLLRSINSKRNIRLTEQAWEKLKLMGLINSK